MPTVRHRRRVAKVWSCKAANGVSVFIDNKWTYVEILKKHVKEIAFKLGITNMFKFYADKRL